MLDYQRIVDDVRSSMFSNSMEGVDFLRAAAADYSVACDEVNERLRRCGGLLRQGLRSEAIQLAEIEPNLLDLVATLDFPERRQWEEVSAHYGIVAPGPLLFDVAADLNEAYAIEQPLTELLRHHRLLALARGPLKNRINTIRSLIQADSDNPIWREDLQTFEAERLKQLQREVADATQAGDLMTLATLDDELRADGWSSILPASLVKWAAGARQKLERRDSRANLERIAAGLHDAHAACDADFARQWREQWNACAAEIDGTQGDPFLDMASSALAWLAEQDELTAHEAQHGAAVAKLAGGLAGAATAPELRRRHNDAVAHGFQLSEDLEMRYRERLDQLARAARRRRMAIVSGIGVATLLTVALIVWGVRSYLFNQDVERQSVALGALLDKEDFSAAKDFVARLKSDSPAVANSEEIEALNRRLETALQKEADRHTSFEGFLQAAKGHGPEQPDYEALQQATKLVKNDAEKLEIQRFKQVIAAADRTAAERRSALFVAALEPFNARLKNLSGLVADPKQLQAEIDRFRGELKNLEKQSGEVDSEAKNQEDAILTALDTLESGVKRQREEGEQLAAVTRAIGDPERYKSELTGYSLRFPDSARGADFQRTAEQFPCWIGVAKWNELLTTFRPKDVTQLDPAAAKELLVKAKAVLEKHGEYPDADALRLRLAYLEAIAQRVDSEQQRIEEPLKRLFADALIADLWMIEAADGGRFYLKDKPNLPASGMAPINYITGFDLVEKKRGVDSGKLAFNGAAPQVGLAKAVRPLIKELNDTNWEPTFFHIVKAIDENKDIDPILKVSLLRQTLDIGGRGSTVFARAFSKHLEKLTEQNVNPFANWLDPKDQDAANQRRRAELALKEFPDVAAAGKELAEELKMLRQPPGKIHRWIGWLRRGAAGNWRCEPASLRDQAGDLFVVHKGLGDGITFDRVGTVKDGIATIAVSADNLPPEGSPVFLVAP